MLRNRIIIVVAALTPLAMAHAAETITYAYDAQGRVVQVLSTGSINGISSTCYYYDKAHNRVRETVVQSTTCP